MCEVHRSISTRRKESADITDLNKPIMNFFLIVGIDVNKEVKSNITKDTEFKPIILDSYPESIEQESMKINIVI